MAHWLRRYHAPGPLTDADRGEIEAAVRHCYLVARLAPPTIIWASSPHVGRAAAGIASRLLPSPGGGSSASEITWQVRQACVEPVRRRVHRRAREHEPEVLREVNQPVESLARSVNRTWRAMWNWNDHTRWESAAVLRPVIPPNAVTGAGPGSGGITGYETVAGEAWWLGPGGIRVSRSARKAFEAFAVSSRVVWWAFPRFAILSEPPEILRLEVLSTGERRLHDADGPALRWQYQAGEGFWHGLPVPLDLITPGWPVREILLQRNSEIQRAAIERIGWLAYLEQAGLELIATAPDPGNPPHMLSLYADPTGRMHNARILVMVNGSPDRSGADMRYAEPVPARFDDPVAAAAWQYGVPVHIYREVARRT